MIQMTDKDKHIILYIIITILSLLYTQSLYNYNKEHHKCIDLQYTIDNISTYSDTITYTDTLYIDKPIPKYIYNTKEKVDTLIQIINNKDTLTDTLYQYISLPIIEKEYGDSTYKAIVKGVQFNQYPYLESIELYHKDNYITNTVTIPKKQPKWHIGLNMGIHYGYNFHTNKFEPYVGIGIGLNYNIK